MAPPEGWLMKGNEFVPPTFDSRVTPTHLSLTLVNGGLLMNPWLPNPQSSTSSNSPIALSESDPYPSIETPAPDVSLVAIAASQETASGTTTRRIRKSNIPVGSKRLKIEVSSPTLVSESPFYRPSNHDNLRSDRLQGRKFFIGGFVMEEIALEALINIYITNVKPMLGGQTTEQAHRNRKDALEWILSDSPKKLSSDEKVTLILETHASTNQNHRSSDHLARASARIKQAGFVVHEFDIARHVPVLAVIPKSGSIQHCKYDPTLPQMGPGGSCGTVVTSPSTTCM